MDYIGGYQVREPNYILRFAFIAIVGIAMSAAVFFWTGQLYLNSDYQDMPVSKQSLDIKRSNIAKRKALNLVNQQLQQELNN